MFCTHCGKQISDESAFCNFCGTSTTANGTSVAVAAPAPTKIAPAKKGDALAKFKAEVEADGRFENPRFFDDRIFTPVAISQNGYVGTWQIEETGWTRNLLTYVGIKPARVFVAVHASEIISFEVVERKTSGASGAVIGGLVFGGAGALAGALAGGGKAARTDLNIVTTRLDIPFISINMFDRRATTGSVPNPKAMNYLVLWPSHRANKVYGEIMVLCSSLEALLIRERQAAR